MWYRTSTLIEFGVVTGVCIRYTPNWVVLVNLQFHWERSILTRVSTTGYHHHIRERPLRIHSRPFLQRARLGTASTYTTTNRLVFVQTLHNRDLHDSLPGSNVATNAISAISQTAHVTLRKTGHIYVLNGPSPPPAFRHACRGRCRRQHLLSRV